MITPNNPNPNGSVINIGTSISNTLVVHENINQQVIVTTEDKLRLVLLKSENVLLSKRDWITPATLLISFIATLCTADFKDAFGATKEFWHGIFVILSVLTAAWLIFTLGKLLLQKDKGSIDNIVQEIKSKN